MSSSHAKKKKAHLEVGLGVAEVGFEEWREEVEIRAPGLQAVLDNVGEEEVDDLWA
jgi:hypothetical protein